jgi:gliding motility-associated-like protein
MKRAVTCLIFLCLFFSLKAQPGKESWHWAFGDSCALDFSSGVPVAGKSNLDVVEGTASISDKNTGQLLFYTDGTTVWDKNGNSMPNGFGLYGGYGTSSNAALIVPLPGSSTIYYLFTLDQGGYRPQTPMGANYSIIDMSLNGGLGDVTLKNHPLTPPPTTEKMVGIKHCNGNDYWVITHPFNSNAFNAYKVTSLGVDTIPVVSHVGTIEKDSSGGTFMETIGCMKASPNGKKLALAIQYYIPLVEIYDFNNSTGVISNPITISFSGDNSDGAYGVAFSPDSKKLYASFQFYLVTQSLYFPNALIQYDLSNYNYSAIKSSAKMLDSTVYVGAMQLAPNGKLYIGRYNTGYVGIINNPNNLGTACNYQQNGLVLDLGSESKAGLPNFIDTKDSTSINSSTTIPLCNFSSYNLIGGLGNSYQWSNGTFNDTTTITTFGKYWLNYTNNMGCRETDTFNVIQTQAQIINVLHDTSICNYPNASATINASFPNTISYNWSDGYNLPIHTISLPNTYWVDYSFNNFCVARDSFNFHINNLPYVSLGDDTTLCIKNYTLYANSNNNNTFLWNSGVTTQSINTQNTTNYWVIITDTNGCKNSDTIHLTFNTPPIIQILHDTSQCSNVATPVQINASFPNIISYLWNDGYTSPIRTISLAGNYVITYTSNNTCVARDSFRYTIVTTPSVNLGNDTSFCSGEKLLDATNASSTYIWSTGSTTSSSIIVTEPGVYSVKVNHNGCFANDTLIVSPKYNILSFEMPNVVTPNNDGINDFIDFGVYQFSFIQLEIFNRWGTKVFESKDPSCIWKPTEEDGTYFYSLQYRIDCGSETQNKILKGFITLLK